MVSFREGIQVKVVYVKRFYTTLLIVTVLILGAQTFAAEKVSVQINNSALNFKTAPVLVKGELMVPMREFFEALGTQVTWYPEGRVIAAYKNNMYVKLTVNQRTAYRNGKSVSLPVAPYVVGGRTLVPAKFIADTFDMKFTKVSTSGYRFTSNSSTPTYYLYDGNFYKKMESNLYGVSYHIPSYWQALNTKAEVYGIDDPYEHYEIRGYYADKTYVSADAYLTALKADFKKRFGTYSVLEQSDYTSKSFSFKWIRLSGGTGSSQKTYIYYVVVHKEKAYILEGRYFDRRSIDDFKTVMKNAASSFAISNQSVQIKDEHYIEYAPVYDHDLHIAEELYSNMDVYGRTKISGTIQTSINHVIVSVTKDSSTAEFFLPINKNNSSFDGYFYLPFGLGKHDVTLYLQQAKDNKRLKAIQFSVINTSSKKLRYLIPTKYVEKDSGEINGLANLQTYRLAGDYQKAKTLLNWMTENITIENASSVDVIRTAYNVFNSDKGTSREVCFLYTALLRTIDIPTRLYMGISNSNSIDYWVEAEINGRWTIVDVVGSMQSKAAFKAGTIKDYTEGFDLGRTEFYGNFKTTAPLND